MLYALNFHYIPPRYRILLLSELYKFAINEDDESDDMQTRIRISYDILTQSLMPNHV